MGGEYYNIFQSIRDFQKFAELIKENPTGFKVLLMDFFSQLSEKDKIDLARNILGENLFNGLVFLGKVKEELEELSKID
ncbi:MAG: hypothetical protein AAB397_01095 [Patescibacteria group bacterium]